MENSYLKINQEPKAFKEKLETLSQSSNKGVYKLYYLKDGKPKEIQRLVSKDQQGVLYIGMTDGPLLYRVGNLQKALVRNTKPELEKPASSGHTQMGKKYYRIRKKINYR